MSCLDTTCSGVELVAGHSSIIADLPTNGLDSASAFDVVNSYKKVAAMGDLSMMCSLVQPSPELLNLFDNVLLMSKGVCLYFGPVQTVERYFFGLGYQMPSTKALPDYLEELSVAPERFYHASHTSHEQNMHRIASSSAIDGGTPIDAVNTYRPVKQVQFDEKGVPFIELDHVGDKDDTGLPMQHTTSIQTTPIPGSIPQSAGTVAPPREPALDDEFGGRDPNAPKPARQFSIKGHTVQITHTEAMNHLFRAYKQSEEYKQLGLELWQMAPTYVDPKAEERKLKDPEYRERNRKFNSSFMLQVELCIHRQFQIITRNKATTIGGFIRQIMIALLVGSLFWQIGTAQKDARTRFGLFFFMLSFNTMGSIQSIPALMEQRLVYYSQTHAGYYRGAAFYISYILTEIPLSAINTFLFVIVLYPMSGLANGIQSEEFGYLFLLIFLMNLVSSTSTPSTLALVPNSLTHLLSPLLTTLHPSLQRRGVCLWPVCVRINQSLRR